MSFAAYIALALLALAALASMVGFAMVGLDKWAAARGGRRTPERTLHTVEALGGWPGSLAAQRLFRHKTVKASYRRTFAAMAVLHLLVSAALVGAAVTFLP